MLLTQCKQCGQQIDRNANKRLRSFCSAACRTKNNNAKAYPSQAEWQRNYHDRQASNPSADKKKCAICERWYKRVGRHVSQRHGMTAREYRAGLGLPVSIGIMTEEASEHMRALAYENGMDKSLLVKGKNTRFKVGDPRARIKKPCNGKTIQRNDYY